MDPRHCGAALERVQKRRLRRHSGNATEPRSIEHFVANPLPAGQEFPRGLLAGLDMATGVDALALTYATAVAGVAYGARETVNVLKREGFPIERIVISGGAAASPLVRQWVADATGMPVLVPECSEPVLLGAAMLGSIASGRFASVADAASAMVRNRAEVTPDPNMRALHDAKFRAFEDLQATGRRLRAIMGAAVRPPAG
jgi:D-ribulokinase